MFEPMPMPRDEVPERINISLFREGEHWIAQCDPGGPDVTQQGPNIREALDRLGLALQSEAIDAGGLQNIQKWHTVSSTSVTAERDRLREALTKEPTQGELASLCLSYRHDFGLLDDEDQREWIVVAREWWRATQKELIARAALNQEDAG